MCVYGYIRNCRRNIFLLSNAVFGSATVLYECVVVVSVHNNGILHNTAGRLVVENRELVSDRAHKDRATTTAATAAGAATTRPTGSFFINSMVQCVQEDQDACKMKENACINDNNKNK